MGGKGERAALQGREKDQEKRTFLAPQARAQRSGARHLSGWIALIKYFKAQLFQDGYGVMCGGWVIWK